ncbi:MAG: hypothetical protein ACLP2P_16870 [Desulfobaccales bacterium]
MTKCGLRGVGLWLLLPVLLLAGCTAGETYRGAASADTNLKSIPPALRDTDPSLRDWYSPPYFNPYEMP